MLHLILVRHARAVAAAAGTSDIDRALDPRGAEDAQLMALRLAGVARPLRLLTSPALRALSTAQHFADALQIDRQQIVEDARIYDASLAQLLAVVHDQPPQPRLVVLFGHNPGISELASALNGRASIDMGTCALLELELPGPTWADVKPASGRIIRHWLPETRG